MPAKKNLVVFDIDGTLTDSVTQHQAGFVQALQQLGVQEINQDFHAYKHHTDLHIARTIYEAALPARFDTAAVSRFESLLYDHIAAAGSLQEIKGAKQFVTFLEKETDFGVCYATGSMLRPAVFKLQAAGITFDPVQLATSNYREERAAIVQEAIRNARLYYNQSEFEKIIAFGDGIWDLKTAQELGVGFVGIGVKNKTAMEAAGMQWHGNDFTELDTAILN